MIQKLQYIISSRGENFECLNLSLFGKIIISYLLFRLNKLKKYFGPRGNYVFTVTHLKQIRRENEQQLYYKSYQLLEQFIGIHI